MSRSRLIPAALLALALVGLSAPTAAVADPPVDFEGGYIVDTVGALEGQEAEVQAALDDLSASTSQTLYVAFVDSFESPSDRNAWVEATADLNQLGDNNVILAVAVEDRVFSLSAPTTSEINPLTNEIGSTYVEPELADDDWAAAAIGAAEGVRAAVNGELSGGSDSGFGGFLVILALFAIVAIIAIVLVVVARVRKRRKERERIEAAQREQQELDQRAGSLLVQLDDALKTSQQELGFAVAQFGADATRPFAEALTSATTKVREAFTLKQQLDDAFPDTDEERIEWTNRIITLTEAADAELDEQAEAFEELRALDKNAPETLGAIATDAEAISGRLDAAERTRDTLVTQYEGETVATLNGNIEQARKLLDFATESASDAAATLRSGSSNVALTVRAAQQSLDQARQLLDAVDKVKASLATASEQVESEIGDVRDDIAEARALTASLPHLKRLIEDAEHTIALARSNAGGRADPVATVRRLQEAEARLDEALADTREQRQQSDRARAYLGRAMQTADAQISAAADFISTRRGAVGPHARQQLAEAQRLLNEASARSGTDPVTALAAAQRSGTLASAAIREAQSDINDYMHRRDDDDWFGGGGGMRRRGGGGGDAFTGAIIGGVLGGMLGGGGGIFGGGGGGFGGGGGWSGSGGGFGGSGSGGSF